MASCGSSARPEPFSSPVGNVRLPSNDCRILRAMQQQRVLDEVLRPQEVDGWADGNRVKRVRLGLLPVQPQIVDQRVRSGTPV